MIVNSIVTPIVRPIVSGVGNGSGGGTPTETFNIVDQDDNALVDQSGNNLVWSE